MLLDEFYPLRYSLQVEDILCNTKVLRACSPSTYRSVVYTLQYSSQVENIA